VSSGLHDFQIFANLRRTIYPEELDYVDQVLAFAKEKVAQHVNSADLHSQASQSNILSLLLAPLKSYFSMFTALTLPNFIPLLHAQPYPTRRAVAGEIAKNLLQNQITIDSEDGLKAILEVLRVIIKEGTQQTSGYPGGPLQRKGAETDETIEEQGWLARIVHLLQAESNDTQFKVLRIFQFI
jgi:vacuolar protein sorting-associated protein 35